MTSKRAIALLAVLAVAALSTAAIAQETAPRLTVVEPLKDFGTVPKGTKLEWDFVLKNTGSADLEVLNVQPACGCTVAEYTKVIKPGQTGKIHAVVDTAQFSGPISKSIAVQTNDTSTPNAQLTVHAMVKPYVDARPGFVRFLTLQGEPKSDTVVVFSEEEAPFEIVKIESPAPFIKTTVKKIDDPSLMVDAGRKGQNQYAIKIDLDKDARPGPIAEKLTVYTNSKYQPEFQIAVSGLVRPAYSVSPTVLNFSEITKDDPAATRTIFLKTNDASSADAFKVTKVESSPSIVTEVKAGGQPGSYEISVSLAKDAKPGAIDDTLKIHTSDKRQPVYTVPVRGTIKG